MSHADSGGYGSYGGGRIQHGGTSGPNICMEREGRIGSNHGGYGQVSYDGSGRRASRPWGGFVARSTRWGAMRPVGYCGVGGRVRYF